MRPENVPWLPDNRRGLPHGLWRAPDTEATEREITTLITALIDATKPAIVVETGAYQGHTTLAAATMLAENARGIIHTYELDPERANAVQDALGDANLAHVARVHPHAISNEDAPPHIDLAFIDSGMRTRQHDMNIIWPRLTPGGLVIMHDTAPGRPPASVTPPTEHQMIDLATPRGCRIYQKPWP